MFIFALNVSVNKTVNFHNDHNILLYSLLIFVTNDYKNIRIISMHNFAFILFIYLFVYSRHEVHSMNTHTLQNAG